ncbi:MAG: hypothetical protein OXC95_11550, partial [Dehalococcoidia bacterium]|nr:hypothetical protein [Dehalococcoidia bacterium]
MSSEDAVRAKRSQKHNEKVREYIEKRASALTTFKMMDDAYDQAKQTIITSGAVVVSGGTIKAGWYNFSAKNGENPDTPEEEAKINFMGGAASIAAAVGAPTAAWTLVGAFGTASTGTAIRSLSGAAATSATAAWFGGGAVAAGGL